MPHPPVTNHVHAQQRCRSALPWLLALAACASGPVPIAADAEEVLANASQALDAGQPEVAGSLILDRHPESFPRRLRDRRTLLLARAQSAQGEHFAAFETIRDFADDHPHSDLRDAVVQLEYEIGRLLSKSDRGFLFFWSDRRAGRTVLEHLVTRYPDNPWLADALRTLGDMAMQDGQWILAQERYRDLLRRRPESEWVPLARFQFAMSLCASLRGPDYDLDGMQRAARELADFLRSPPENPEFVKRARDALQQLLAWQAQRHVQVADFYQRVGNEPGCLHHLALAADDGLSGTLHHDEAVRRLAARGAGK
jgi:outer membrane protein assembly factor BamD (BamD/ComL family)